MLRISSLAAALLLGLAALPAGAEPRPDAPAALRTLEQNRKVSIGLPPAAPPPQAEARAAPPPPPVRRLASAR